MGITKQALKRLPIIMSSGWDDQTQDAERILLRMMSLW
jgi:hypothetical protein